jgi:iron complex outermembrane receptor protein
MMIVTALRAGLLLGVSAAGLYAATPALAQEGAGDAGSGDIIVTARRTEERLQDVPISITVYNQQQLTNRNIATATDLATATPSLSVNQRFGAEKASFAIRGFNQEGTTAPTVGVYFADVVGIRSQSGTTGGNSVGAGAFMDLQNVQVLKGPQGTLFGRNTTGGAILLVPQKPTDKLEGYVEGTLGNYDAKRVQGALNIPLADTFKVRVAIDRNKRDGYMKNMSGVGADSFQDLDYFAARLSIVADLTPDLENYTIAHYSDSHSTGLGSRIVACDPNAVGFTAITALAACDQIARARARGDGPLTSDVSNPDPYLRIKQWQVINTTTWKAGDNLTVKNIMSYGEYRERTKFNLYSDNFFVSNPPPNLSSFGFPPLTPGTPFQYVVLNPTANQNNAAQNSFTEELQLQGQAAGGKLDYVIGGYLEFARPMGWNAGHTSVFLDCASPELTQCRNNPFFIGSITDSRNKYAFDNHGVFAQATFNISDKFAITAGGRYTFDKIVAQAETTDINFLPLNFGVSNRTCQDTIRFTGPGGVGKKVVTEPSGCHVDFRQSTSKPTWLIDLEYKPSSDLMVFAKYARGYRQGGLNVGAIGAESWGPENVDDYELGLKTSFRGAVSGFFNITGFYNNFKDQQVNASLIAKPGQSGRQTIVNAGRSEIYGVEIDASATVFDSLRFDLGYTYLRTKVKELDLPTLPATSPFASILATTAVGQELIFSPHNKVTLTATYTLPLDESIGKVSLGATFTHTDKYFYDASGNTSIPAFLRIMPKSDLLNLNVNWDNVAGTPVSAAFFMTNVTNQIYAVASGGGWSSAGFGDLYYGQPRMWGFRLKYKFGE